MKILLKSSIIGFWIILGLMIIRKFISKNIQDKSKSENIESQLDDETKEKLKNIKKEIRRKIVIDCAGKLAFLSGVPLLLILRPNINKKCYV